MTPTDTLHSLIKSLSKGEKAYFKKSFRSHGGKEKIYLVLFDAIDTQDVYDEAALRTKFAGKGFLKQFAVTKNYLFNQVLKSLIADQREERVDDRIYTLIQESEILLSKTLYREANKRLKKALELSERFEKFSLAQQIHLLRHRFFVAKTGVIQNGNLEIYKELKTVAKRIDEIVEYRGLVYQFWDTMDSNMAPSAKARKVEELCANPLLADNCTQLSLRAKLVYHNLRNVLFRRLNYKVDLVFKESKTVFDLLHENPDFASEELSSYIASLANIIVLCLELGKEQEFQKYERILKGLTAKYPEQRVRVLEIHTMQKLHYFILFRKIKEAAAYIKNIEATIESEAEHFNPDILIATYCSIANISFINRNYSKAIQYINKIIHNQQSSSAEIKCFAYLLYLLVQFEKEDFDHLEYQLKFIKKFILKNHSHGGYELPLLDFFKAYMSCDTRQEKENSLRALIRNLERAEELPPDAKAVLGDFNVIAWAESKLKNISYLEALTNE